MARAGDPCKCGHYYTVVQTKVVGLSRVQYVGCRNCGQRPADNKLAKASSPSTVDGTPRDAVDCT